MDRQKSDFIEAVCSVLYDWATKYYGERAAKELLAKRSDAYDCISENWHHLDDSDDPKEIAEQCIEWLRPVFDSWTERELRAHTTTPDREHLVEEFLTNHPNMRFANCYCWSTCNRCPLRYECDVLLDDINFQEGLDRDRAKTKYYYYVLIFPMTRYGYDSYFAEARKISGDGNLLHQFLDKADIVRMYQFPTWKEAKMYAAVYNYRVDCDAARYAHGVDEWADGAAKGSDSE